MSAGKPGDLLRVVLDTNVYFSAFNSTRGVPFDLWRRAVRREYALLISPAIMRELAEVLRADLDWPEPDIIAQLKLVAKVAQIVAPKLTLEVIAADPDDNRVLECAVAGNAGLIASYDYHLTRLKAFQGIAIVRPVDFLRTLGA
jgi:putative PIN family toxin of toxin-antitoxin system